jgi:hypothetical protein
MTSALSTTSGTPTLRTLASGPNSTCLSLGPRGRLPPSRPRSSPPLVSLDSTGHTVTLETPSAVNENKRIIYLVGGVTESGISDETWSWWPDGVKGDWVPGDTTTSPDIWRKDFTTDAKFRTALGQNGLYKQGSPAVYYLTPDSNLTYLRKFWVPTPENEEMRRQGALPDIRKYLTSDKLEMLHSVGLHTIRDLAEANKYVILKLRGFDFPQVPLSDRLHFDDICDFRELAKAVVDKCR